MKKELDLRNEVATRDYKKQNPIINFGYHFLGSFLQIPHHVTYKRIDDISKCKGACFVIFNHLSRLDHLYINGMCYPKRANMLAGYVEFFRSHLHTVFKLNRVIPKKNYANDLISMRAISKIIKSGGCVTFAPEGLATNDGMNKPIVPGTGKMLKHYKVPVYFVELRGQYLQNNKTCLDERYGKTYATSKLLFSPEDLEKMSGEEIDDAINLAFKHDEYAWQKEQKIKWKTKGRICHRLEDILYRCPRCGAELEMEGKEDYIKCNHCGNGAKMDDYYNFIPFDDSCVIPESPSEWVKQERIHVIKEIRKDPNYSYTEHVQMGRIPNDHYLTDLKTSEIVDEGDFTVDHNGVHFKGKLGTYDFDLSYNEIYTLITEVDSSYFNFFVDAEYTDIFPEKHSFMKFNLLIEEMHRLHVNFYKNFPWNDYMYKEDESK